MCNTIMRHNKSICSRYISSRLYAGYVKSPIVDKEMRISLTKIELNCPLDALQAYKEADIVIHVLIMILTSTLIPHPNILGMFRKSPEA